MAFRNAVAAATFEVMDLTSWWRLYARETSPAVIPLYFGNGINAGLAPGASGDRAVFMIIDR